MRRRCRPGSRANRTTRSEGLRPPLRRARRDHRPSRRSPRWRSTSRPRPPADAAWAVHFLIGRRPKRLVSSPKLRAWAAAEAGIPDWLFEESYHAVGDLAETITLLLPDAGTPRLRSPTGSRSGCSRCGDRRRTCSATRWSGAWRELGRRERYVWNKLITGSFRVGPRARLVERALAAVSGVPEGVVAHRLMGAWEPTPEYYRAAARRRIPATRT